jgi:arylsulfatase A-like enzyme/Flp pilus assembly protein TadD
MKGLSVRALLLQLLISFFVLGSCARTDSSAEREALRDLNVVLITVDTLRADYVSAYGDRARTPHIDMLAHEGIAFERCIAQTPLTFPAHATILSGTYPFYHRLRDNGGMAAPAELELVSETLRDAGFSTSAFIGAYVLHSKWGLHQGFDKYSDEFPRSRYERILLQNEKRADEVIGRAKEWIARHKESRFFTWIHIYDPHTPYEPPAPFDKYHDDPYRGEVEYTDSAIGELVDFLREEGLYDKSLIVLTADHGESLGSHGEREHGYYVYEPAVWVPLIMRAPSSFSVERVEELVEHVDIVPTILDMLDIPAPSTVQGESLLSLMLGSDPGEGGVAYTETYYPRLHLGASELTAFYRDNMKYINAPREELYDIQRDGGEQRNLAAAADFEERKERLQTELSDFVEKNSASALEPPSVELSREDGEALRALGYLATPTLVADGEPLADPKDKIYVYNHLADATARLQKGEFGPAVEAANEALRDEPNLLEAHVLLGNAYQRQGMSREAVASFERVLELRPDSNFAMLDLLSALINLGENDRVIDKAQRFLQQFPRDPLLYEQLGLAYFFERHYERALESFLQAIDLGPSAIALSKAGEIYAIQGDLDTGETYVRRALEKNPRNKGSFYTLGQIEEARGNLDEAVALYQKELENNPKEYKASFNAAVILKKQGRYSEAIPFYLKTIEAHPRFNVPYFMIADYYYQQGTKLKQAIELCKQGIEANPNEETALLGYQILLRLLMKTNDQASFELYSAKANELMRKTGKNP